MYDYANQTVILCGTYTDEDKLVHINRLCAVYKKVLYYNPNITYDQFGEWKDNKLVLDNLDIRTAESSMMLEPFTVGDTEDGGKWTSTFNREYDVLIIEPSHGKSIKIDKLREDGGWWRIKPLIVISGLDFFDAAKIYKYKNVNFYIVDGSNVVPPLDQIKMQEDFYFLELLEEAVEKIENEQKENI